MLEFLVHWVVTALLLLVVARVVSGIQVEDDVTALLAALVLGLVNALLRPLLVILTLPLTVLTLGLFLLVINAVLFLLASSLVPGFRVRGFGAALLGSLLLSLLNLAVSAVFGI